MSVQLQSWARALGGEGSGVQVLCPGPGHSANDRSLSVKIGGDGQPVVHSHAGDDWQTCRDYVRQRLGLPPFKPNGSRNPAATYEFRDPASGDVRYRKERIERADGTKSFFFKPKGRGGSGPLLYGADRLADVTSEQPVFIVEGEKKVDRLRELGAVAVSGDSGSSSKWLPAHADLLRGLHVVLWPDSDEPGEKYISRAAKCLKDSAASFKAVHPFGPPNGAKGRDVCDWAGDVEALAALAAGAEAYGAIEQKKRPEDNAKTFEQWTEVGNAHRLVRHHGEDVRYIHPLDAWFIWDGLFWRRDDSGDIMRRAEATVEAIFDEAKKISDEEIRTAFRKFALKSQSRAQLSAMVQLAQHNLKVVLSPDKLDADPMLLGVLNGTIDLNTVTFRESRRDDYITKQCAIAYDPAAQCPEWIKFQKKIAGGNIELVAYKQRVFGILLTGEMVEILFIAHGAGQNGKTTELETVSGVLGDYAHAVDATLMLSPNDRSGATPEIVAIKGKRAIFINESGDTDHLNESRVKYLCGNDTMSGRDLFEKPINFRPTHKSFLRTNHKPKIRGTDLGIWRRIHYWPYLVTIPDDEKVVKFRETKLNPERAGILNWMLAGLKDYQAGGLKPPPIVCQATKEYQQEMNTVAQWVEAMCEESTIGTRLYLSEIHEEYAKWATAEHGWVASKKKLAEELRARGYEEDHPRNLTRFKLRFKLRLGDDPG